MNKYQERHAELEALIALNTFESGLDVEFPGSMTSAYDLAESFMDDDELEIWRRNVKHFERMSTVHQLFEFKVITQPVGRTLFIIHQFTQFEWVKPFWVKRHKVPVSMNACNVKCTDKCHNSCK